MHDKPILIAFGGNKRCGKNTATEYLQKTYGAMNFSFAGALKDAVAAIFVWPRRLLEGDTIESDRFRETADEYWTEKLAGKKGSIFEKYDKITPRLVLQHIGTELFREHVHQDIWVLSVQKMLKDQMDIQGPAILTISDTRFENEAEKMKAMGATIVWIDREQQEGQQQSKHDIHKSEIGFRHRTDLVNYYITNNGKNLDDYLSLIDEMIGKVLLQLSTK